ncbi:MAG TPA: DNA gyrase subunit A, partial [Magnetospirillaceae bacterium]|nr:DNA gyrase subunit A [Magnetospirillaceae bacterium]
NTAHKKSARIVGDTIGKYHPHGELAVYDALVRLAQDFVSRYPLVDGQGNFGNIDGDSPAAQRYTEARLTEVARLLLDGIDENAVDLRPTYDGTENEPVVLPGAFPNLLANGSAGIAVGMATNIPPHNLGEVIDACCAFVDNPNVTLDELMELVPAPDFPTGGIILGRAGTRSAYTTGRGSVIMRARCAFEEIRKDRTAIVVTEIPYQVNKSRLIEQIAELVRDKKIEGISDLRDESDRDGVRVVIELKRDAVPDVVQAQLYRFSQLQTSFGVNCLALNGGRPQMMTLVEIIKAFVEFREEVITRRTVYLLGKSRERAHVLVGLALAVANLDEVIALIRNAPDPGTAREQLMAKAWPADDVEVLIKLIDEPGRGIEDGKYTLSEIQAKAILDLRLHRLTGLERDKLHDELNEIGKEIEEFLLILSSRVRLMEILREELVEMKTQFATPRRTTIEESEFEVDIEDLIAREDMVVTVTNTGYIKRVPLSEYRAQRRGGKGRSSMSVKEEDFVTDLFVANTHTPMIFFSSDGIAYKMKVYRLPLGTPQSKGKAMINLLPLDQGETISTVMPLPEDEESWGNLHIMFATQAGGVRRNLLSDFTDIRANGKIAMKLDEGDHLVGVHTCSEDEDVLLATKGGKCIRFPVTDVRVFAGRTSTGVRGIRLEEGDSVISMSMLHHVRYDSETRDAYARGELPAEQMELMKAEEQEILTVSVNGYGKRTSAYEYRITGRGGSGIANMELTEKTGPTVVASFPVLHEDGVMLVTNAGKLIRTSVESVRVVGRKTQGVMMLRTAEDEQVMSVARLAELGSNDEEAEGEGVEGGDTAPETGAESPSGSDEA